MSSFAITVPSSMISAASLCLPAAASPCPSGFEHILFVEGVCYATDGKVLLAHRLSALRSHNEQGRPPFGISGKMARAISGISSALDNTSNSFEVTVTPREDGDLKGGSVRIGVSGSLILEEEMDEDFYRMAASIRGGLERMKIPSVSSDACSLVPRVCLATNYLELACKIADRLNVKSENSVGVVLGGEDAPVLFSINEDASLIVMPVMLHPYSSVFDEGESESESDGENIND